MRFRDLTVQAFTDALASNDPTPGGGTASAVAGATGAALVAMVARTTAASKKFADRAERMEAIAREAESLRADFLALADEDAAAFDTVMAAFRLPRGTPAEQEARSRAVQEAYRTAADPPMKVADFSVRLLGLAERVAQDGTPSAVSDAGVAGLLAATALEGAALNVRINVAAIKDEALRQTFVQRLDVLQASGRDQAAKVQAAVAGKLG